MTTQKSRSIGITIGGWYCKLCVYMCANGLPHCDPRRRPIVPFRPSPSDRLSAVIVRPTTRFSLLDFLELEYSSDSWTSVNSPDFDVELFLRMLSSNFDRWPKIILTKQQLCPILKKKLLLASSLKFTASSELKTSVRKTVFAIQDFLVIFRKGKVLYFLYVHRNTYVLTRFIIYWWYG